MGAGVRIPSIGLTYRTSRRSPQLKPRRPLSWPVTSLAFRWSRLFWGWLVPVIPLATTWDATLSALRIYFELRA